MVELLVVMIIMAILMAITIPSFMGTRRTVDRKKVISAAQSYKQAIAQFTVDHGLRVPMPNVANEWPSAAAIKGPVNFLGDRYMISPPEVMSSDHPVTLLFAPAQPTQTEKDYGAIVYEPVLQPGVPATTYRLTVYHRSTTCTLGTAEVETCP
jgi:type II secretory pathway pseudopilin PulG